jgi:hypothetical protein
VICVGGIFVCCGGCVCVAVICVGSNGVVVFVLLLSFPGFFLLLCGLYHIQQTNKMA